jgi:hypothetical protein
VGPAALFGLQFLVLLALGVFVWHRLSLGEDFAAYAQAFSSIGTGHLDPACTVCGYRYIDLHFELFMWPMSILYFVFRTTFVLVFVQALSLAVASAAAYFWIASWARKSLPPGLSRVAVCAGAAIVLLINPLAYGTVAVDFHFEATATMFAVLGAYAVWRGAVGWALIFCVCCLLCGDVGGLYVTGIGLSAMLAGRRHWRIGGSLMVAGVVWIGIIGSIGANDGSPINLYAYLAGRATLPSGLGAAVVLLGGMAGHPVRVLRVLHSRLHYFGRYLATGGAIGVATAWGFGVPALVLLTSSLPNTTLYIGERFQQFAVTPFVTVGTAMFIGMLLRDGPGRSWLTARLPGITAHRNVRTAAASVLAVVSLGVAGYQSHNQLPNLGEGNALDGFLPAAEAATLRSILDHTPDGAEVIASLPISGRFGARRFLYVFANLPATIPIHSRNVVMVLDTAHTLMVASPDQDLAALDKVQKDYRAHVIATGPDVIAVEWNPIPTDTEIHFP